MKEAGVKGREVVPFTSMTVPNRALNDSLNGPFKISNDELFIKVQFVNIKNNVKTLMFTGIWEIITVLL